MTPDQKKTIKNSVLALVVGIAGAFGVNVAFGDDFLSGCDQKPSEEPAAGAAAPVPTAGSLADDMDGGV